MSSSEAKVTSTVDSSVSYVGRVKWFNNKAGYGFVTVVSESADGDRVGEDIFVHHSGVNVTSEQYKYLVQGEYVSFNLRESDSDAHPWQVDSLTGLWGGKLLCETRSEQRAAREQSEEGSQRTRGNTRGRRKRVRPRGSGPRGDQWSFDAEASQQGPSSSEVTQGVSQ